MCGKRSLFLQPYKEELNDFLPTHFFSLLLTLMPTHAFLAAYRSCAMFQVSDSQAMRLGLQESCTVTLLSLGMVPACTRSPPGDSEERICLWDHPKLTHLGHSVRIAIIPTCQRWPVYPLTQVHSALTQDC